MPVSLGPAQAALSSIIHTNPATIVRETYANQNGVRVRTGTQSTTTVCHPIYPQAQPRIAAVNDDIAGDAASVYISFPYGTDVQVDDRVITLGKRYRVVRALPSPQFALATVCGVVDVTGES